MSATILANAMLFDGISDDLREAHVLVEGGLIRAVSPEPITSSAARTIDLRGRTLMPGLTDAHVHCWVSDLDINRATLRRTEYLAAFAIRNLAGMLDRGFTTVRDAGGTGVGIAAAQRDGLVPGARLLYAGRFMSQTGGHADTRPPADFMCGCSGHGDGMSRVAALVDSPDAMRREVREELRKGAHAIKIMGSGGISSPADPLDSMQFSDAEIAVAVEETARHGAYVMAHCHPDSAIRRCVELGVRSIEHGSLVEPETAKLIAERGAWVVPTLAVMFALKQDGAALGFPAVSMAKLERIAPRVQQSLAALHAAGVNLGFGTDLLGPHQNRQGSEFVLRREVLPAATILRQATSGNAALFRMETEIGTIAPGFVADMIVVDGNPLKDIGLLDRGGATLPLIMQGGCLHRCAL